MYQELQVFEDSFDNACAWGTKGNNLPLPALAVGDVFAHGGLELAKWWQPPEPGQVFRITQVRHVFRDTGPGPEADHLLQIVVARDDSDGLHTNELADAEAELEQAELCIQQLTALLIDLSGQPPRR